MLSKDKIVFDTTNATDSDSVGAYVRSSDGTLITHTTIGAAKALDVNLANTSIAVTATDLDIRNLSSATDSVSITDGGGSITVDGTVTVTATDLDIRNLTSADVVTANQGTSPWVVSATDLDVRNLSHTQDSIKIGDGTDFLAVNADGSINVTGTFSGNPGDNKAEDAVHASGDIGSYVLSVRQDLLAASTSASGDYQSLKTDALGRLWMNEAHQAMSHAAVSVTTTATALVASALTNRRKLLVQNLDNKVVYLGNSGVTVGNGLKLSPGSNAEFFIDTNVALHGITASGTADVRIMQLA